MFGSDAISIGMFPDRVLISVAANGQDQAAVKRELISVDPGSSRFPEWQGALDLLSKKVEDGSLAKGRVSVVLSNHFVRYLHVPWSPLLSVEPEQLAYVRHRFGQVHGAISQGWDVRISNAPRNCDRIACAVDAALTDSLNDVLGPLGSRYVTLQPLLMTSFNHWRGQLGAQSCWIAVAEPGVICLAFLESEQWRSVRTVKIGSDWLQQLPALVARERFLVAGADECDQVLVLAGDDLSFFARLEGGLLKTDEPRAPLPRRGMSKTDAVLASAVGA